MSELSAKEIYQANLDQVSAAVWARDWTKMTTLFALPVIIRTLDAGVRAQNAEELVQTAIAMRDSLTLAGAQAYHRICLSASFTNAEKTRIEGHHRTYALRGGTYVMPPYESDMRMEMRAGKWLAGSLFARVSNHDLTVIKPGMNQFPSDPMSEAEVD